jgi:hypothetical protein
VVQSHFAALGAPLYAIPVDLFRILAGLVGLVYFRRAFVQASDFSSPDGLIDHRMSQRLFPPTRLSLFQPGIPAGAFRPIFLLACVASILVIVGYHAKAAALVLFLIAVSTLRWNILVVYVDDAIVHLIFFWLILLPVGKTLSLQDWLESGTVNLDVWRAVTVPGASVRFFLANLALVYVAAGAYKFTSPMWRNGTALHAILKLNIAWIPDYWTLQHRGMLRLCNYWALMIEPFLALMFVLPFNSFAKWSVVLCAAAFHLMIIATLKIPFANLAMLGAIPIVMGPEIMQIGLGQPPLLRGEAGTELSPPDMVALALVVTLTLMIVWEVVRSGRLSRLPLWKTHMSGFLGNPMYVALWCVGIVQSYRLFDWIDTRNHHGRYEVFLSPEGDPRTRRQIDPASLFPTSLRHLLLQSYLVGNVWLQIDAEALEGLRRSILARHARRYARLHGGAGRIEAFVIHQRVTADNLTLCRGERRLLMRFTFGDGRAALIPETLGAGETTCVVS